jgi:hypothetical protein
MKLVDELVNTISGQLISKYRYDFSTDPLGLSKQSKGLERTIKSLYGQAYYWHGTGRYHYKHSGESKYDSRATSQTVDVLQSIIKQGGLKPQYDFWMDMNSISLTKNRFHARAYAQFHQYKSDPLKYEYGTTRFWFYVLSMKQLFTNSFLRNISGIQNLKANSDFNSKFQQWGGYVRRDLVENPISALAFYKLRSDIPNNYGLLFGIKKNGVKELRYNPTIERFEVRSAHPATFKQMTHLEVPIANLEETQKMLNAGGIKLTLIPLELVEIFCNSLNFNRLAK